MWESVSGMIYKDTCTWRKRKGGAELVHISSVQPRKEMMVNVLALLLGL